MNIRGRECHWEKVDPQPNEINMLSPVSTLARSPCPFCHANSEQQWVELQKDPFKVGVLCMECSVIYVGVWDDIKDDKGQEIKKEEHNVDQDHNNFTTIVVSRDESNSEVLRKEAKQGGIDINFTGSGLSF